MSSTWNFWNSELLIRAERELPAAFRLHNLLRCVEREEVMSARGGFLERASRLATEWTGTSLAFALAVGTIVVWAITGPIFRFSDTWQLVINTGTTIVTFLMVFLIQRAQNKDSAAIHLKLNELVAALGGASNRLISAEELTEDEVKILRAHYRKLVELAKLDEDFTCAHSIEEAKAEHERKKQSRPEKRRKRKRKHRSRTNGEQPLAAEHNKVPEANNPA
jgi:low affinity Fe/Cu permease